MKSELTRREFIQKGVLATLGASLECLRPAPLGWPAIRSPPGAPTCRLCRRRRPVVRSPKNENGARPSPSSRPRAEPIGYDKMSYLSSGIDRPSQGGR